MTNQLGVLIAGSRKVWPTFFLPRVALLLVQDVSGGAQTKTVLPIHTLGPVIVMQVLV
jgi:hypothetical protein